MWSKLVKIFMHFFLFLLFSIKCFLTSLIYLQPIPSHFPPQLGILRPGFLFYKVFYALLWKINLLISFFPSKIIFFLQNFKVQLFFLKVPFILFDVALFFCLFYLLRKKETKKINFNLLVIFLFMPAIYFYFSVNSFSFKSIYIELIKYFYRFSFQQKIILWLFLVFLATALTAFFLGFKSVAKKIKGILALLPVNITLLVLVTLWVLNLNGFFLSLSNPKNVNWRGFWIWNSGNQEKENFYAYFEKEFNLSFSPDDAKAFLTCQSEYKLFINGTFVGRGSIPSDPPYQYYDQYDIKRFLKKGKNEFKILCYNYFVDTHFMSKKSGGLIFQSEISANSRKKIVVSDDSWNTIAATAWDFSSPRMSDTIGFQEFFNADWKIDEWQKASILGRSPLSPWENLILRPIPQLQFTEVKPKEILKKEKKSMIFDFGQEVTGYLQLKLSGTKKGDDLIIYFSEAINDQGDVDWQRTLFQRDRIGLANNSTVFEAFQRRAFRYIELVPINTSFEEIDIESLSILSPGYPVVDKGSFESSSSLLNEIYQVGKYTLRLAMQDRFEDSLTRERGQYVGDTRIDALVNYYTFSDFYLIKKALREFARSSNGDFVKAVYPSCLKFIIPDYSLLFITALKEYFLYSGDINLVKELYPTVKQQLDLFEGLVDQNGLIAKKDWWIFIDHAVMSNRNKIVSLNMFYFKALKDAEELASFLGKEQDRNYFKDRAEKVKKAVNDKFWLSGDDLFSLKSPQPNYLALLFGLTDKQREEKILYSLEKKKFNPVVTAYFNSFIVETLFNLGKEKEALKLIESYWGKMIACGATTWWETFAPEECSTLAVYGDSLSHAWGAGPTFLLPREILGVKPIDAGYKRFFIKPRIDNNLVWAKGKIPLQDSFIEVYWSKDKGKFQLQIDFEKQAIADVEIPIIGNFTKAFLNGAVIWEKNNEKEEYVKFKIDKPGKYLFEIL